MLPRIDKKNSKMTHFINFDQSLLKETFSCVIVKINFKPLTRTTESTVFIRQLITIFDLGQFSRSSDFFYNQTKKQNHRNRKNLEQIKQQVWIANIVQFMVYADYRLNTYMGLQNELRIDGKYKHYQVHSFEKEFHKKKSGI